MSDEERSVNQPDPEITIEDLKAQTPDDQTAEEVKGGGVGFSDIHVTKPIDVATPKLLG